MRRVVSVWFPHWPTDRLRVLAPLSPEQAATSVVTAAYDGHRRVVVVANLSAFNLGLRSGMAVAQALAIVPGLQVFEAEPQADAAALERLARWCHRVTPLAATDSPDGLWLDVTGCAHLWGGETQLLRSLLDRLARDGLQARAAMADTPGAAHALARHGADVTVVPSGAQGAVMARLAVSALRLPPDLVATLRRLGFEQIEHLTRVPRALLSRRFGPLPGLRLDQAYGHVFEPLEPLAPEHHLQHRITFLEPLLTAEALAMATVHLVEMLCAEMESVGLGARQVDLLFERVDRVVATRIGTARPSRDARHLSRLLNERLHTVDPGFGVEAMHLIIPVAETLHWEQQEGGVSVQDVARLIDQLANRLGMHQLYQTIPMQSEMPDRAVQQTEPTAKAGRDWAEPSDQHQPIAPPVNTPAVRSKPHLALVVSGGDATKPASPWVRSCHLHLVDTSPRPLEEEPPLIDWRRPWAGASAMKDKTGVPWPERLQAPARLLNPPRQIEAIASLPDKPPVAFTWRRRRHLIYRADGPERIHCEWWRHNRETKSVRDYYQVEDECGQRFWLFREGNGQDLSTGDLSWFLHGLF